MPSHAMLFFKKHLRLFSLALIILGVALPVAAEEKKTITLLFSIEMAGLPPLFEQVMTELVRN